MNVVVSSVIETLCNGRAIQFKENDIVEIIDVDNSKYIGRIDFIDSNYIKIDASEKFKSHIFNIRYNVISSIRLINRHFLNEILSE